MKFFYCLIICLLFAQPVFSQYFALIPKGNIVKVPASEGVSEYILGKGFDSNFEDLGFEVFKGKKSTTNEATYSSDYQQIDNSSLFSANARIFTFMGGGKTKQKDKRFAVLTIYYIDKTVTFTPQSNPIGNADFFAHKIHYGWALYYVLSAESEIFNSDVSASLQNVIGIGGDIRKERQNKKLEEFLKLKGLEGKDGGVTLSTNPQEAIGKFKRSASPVPILIEYKAVKDVNTEGIDWSPPLITQGNYILQSVTYSVANVKGNGKHWDAGFGDMLKPDVLIKLRIDGGEVQTKQGKQDSYNGTIVFNKLLNLSPASTLQLDFWDKDAGESDFIGTGFITFDELATKKVMNEIEIKTSGQVTRCILKLEKVE